MDVACLVVALVLLASAWGAARRTRALRRWPRVKAHVVHWWRTRPHGAEPSFQLDSEYVVIGEDGSEEVAYRRYRDPSVVYYAELVYFVDGAVHAADLVFDELVPEVDDFRVNPRDPSDYIPQAPSYRSALILLGLGLVFLGAWWV